MSTVAKGSETTYQMPENAAMVHDTFDAERYHLILGCSQDTIDRIEKLALGLGHGKQGKVIDQALAFLDLAFDSAREGKHIWIVDKDGQPDIEIGGLAG